MNEKAFGAIERSLAMLGFLRADTITEEMARAELANARKLLEAAEEGMEWGGTTSGEWMPLKYHTALRVAIAACRGGDGEKPECLS